MPFEEQVQERQAWELPEITAVGLLTVVSVLAVTSILAAIIESTNQKTPPAINQFFTTLNVGQTLASATGWANPIDAFLLVAAAGLLWWQVQSWREALDDADPDEAGFDHLVRSKSLAAGIMIILFVLAVAAVGGVVANFLIYQSSQGPSSTFLTNHVQAIGEAVASLTLAAVGGFAVHRVRTAVTSDFRLTEVAGDARDEEPLP